ncbi:hypothetical protein QCA50_018439 [Cerrena zonata]|uniref:Uncharacterized protein n=1 Tax=Cerrena zonata TaxID=2478898 RepID=A0AAW0FMR3_9APHY
MATFVQPTQALPSWLTLVSTEVTDANGDVSTSFATMTLPLTYFGPSIPLGTDGIWTYGGLTPPPSTSSQPTPTPAPSATPSSPTETSSSTTEFTSSSSSTSLSSPTSLSSTTSSLSVPTATPAGTSHGISPATLGAILGSVLGFILLVLIGLVIFLLCRQRQRRQAPEEPGETSSFWNRSTSLFSRPARSAATPIWTGWEIVQPPEYRTHVEEDTRSPGEGSPRGSGEEHDPFLTRRSLRDATFTEEMSQTKSGTETLVSLPAAAVVGGGTTRSSPPRTGHIIDPELLSRMMSEQDEPHTPPPPGIRLVEASPQIGENSPLLPPRRLDPDGLGVLSAVRTSHGSGHSRKDSLDRSLGSQKSLGSLELDPQEGVELLTARRVKVGDTDTPRTISTSLLNDPEAGPSTGYRDPLGLSSLSGRLGRFSWFKRLSGATQSDPHLVIPTVDPYTRTPPRGHSRRDSRSRPSSWRPPANDPDLNPSPNNSRNSRGSNLGYLTAGSRPISSVSARSGTSGNTVYHDAVSTPVSDNYDVPSTIAVIEDSPTVPTFSQSGSSSTPRAGGAGSETLSVPTDPPTYDDSQAQSHASDQGQTVDILDIPAPAPASPFVNARPAFPPGLVALPTPRTWRDSYSSSNSPLTNRSSIGIQIDVLEEEPPLAREGWRNISTGGGDGLRDPRRTTFGMPVVIHQPSHISEEASLHSMRSHLDPYSSHSPSGSAPASHHTLTASGSSRPSGSSHSHDRTMSSNRSLAHSSSVSEFDRRRASEVADVGLSSPPLSAVFGGRSGRGSMGSPPYTRPGSPSSPVRGTFPPINELSASSSRTPLLTNDGTITSSRTNDTNTNSSMTTALTDPITGVRMHFPSVPWRNSLEPEHEEHSWNGSRRSHPPNDDMW